MPLREIWDMENQCIGKRRDRGRGNCMSVECFIHTNDPKLIQAIQGSGLCYDSYEATNAVAYLTVLKARGA